MKKQLHVVALLLAFLAGGFSLATAQVTTSAINGLVADQAGQALPGANVLLIHEPTGTKYGTTTRVDGRYSFPNVRVGGPYTLKISYVSYTEFEQKNINLSLGQNLTFDAKLSEQTTELGEVQVTAVSNPILNGDRTGAATTIDTRSIEQMPTISRRIGDLTRLTPQASGSSFAGVDNRLNNITVDGSSFNNAFGLGGQPGDRTGVSPISLDAIEQISVNIAPFDVRQGNFVGAGVNTVTKSGTNVFSGTVYTQFRDNSLVGTTARGNTVNPGTFEYRQFGVAVGGPIIKDKLFFFTSFENDALTSPGTTYRANTGTETVSGNITRVQQTDLNRLQTFLRDTLGYDPGGYQGYDFKTPAMRFLGKLDFNMDDKNKLTLRYTFLNSETDVLASNSTSLGTGNRQGRVDALNFANSNYKIKENIRSIVGEWNSNISNSLSNNMIIGYTYQDESRATNSSFFPFVDILNAGTTYTSFGYEPFTPSNELRYKTLQFQNNLIWVQGDHTMTFGIAAERYESENVFFPGSQSVYVYNSLADFYTDAKDYVANPNRTTSPVTLNLFQYRYSNIPGLDKPVQPLKVNTASAYLQDEWKMSQNVKITAGLRMDLPMFENTGFYNGEVDTVLTFRDENRDTVRYSTDKMPNANVLFSPRIGFNIDVTGDKSTQVRGGTGIFSGRPAYVWISNQIGNNGVLTGFIQNNNTTARPFNPDPTTYAPADSLIKGTPAAAYELALTDPDFKFPQLWRTNLAIDQKLPFLDLVATAEVIYSRDVNGMYYINANLGAPNGFYLAGEDTVKRWLTTGANRLNSKISNAMVLKNQNVGEAVNLSFSLERPMQDGLYMKAGYNYGVAKNTIDPGSIASGSWFGNAHNGDPNNPGVGFSANRSGHRFFAAVSYKKDIFKFGPTMISAFFERRNNGTASYVYNGDFNNDGGRDNDLFYVPKDTTEMNFVQYTFNNNTPSNPADDITFTPRQQAQAWDAFIEQDEYLSTRRGQFTERNGVLLPYVNRLDVSFSQDFAPTIRGKKHAFQFRADVLNFGNMLNSEWGVSQSLVTFRPLTNTAVNNASGVVSYRLQHINGQLINKSYLDNATTNDVWRLQFSLRYSF